MYIEDSPRCPHNRLIYEGAKTPSLVAPMIFVAVGDNRIMYVPTRYTFFNPTAILIIIYKFIRLKILLLAIKYSTIESDNLCFPENAI